MPREYQSEIWNALLPEGWKSSNKIRGDEIVLDGFFHPEGVGQLKVVVLSKSVAPSRGDSMQVFRGKLEGYYQETKTGVGTSRFWFLLCGSQWITARYACYTNCYDWELDDVDAIVKSISENAQPSD